MPDWPFGLLRCRAYGVIYCDPPWSFEGYSESGSGVPQRADAQHYPTMTVEEMARLPVGELARNDCALFMWGISSHMPQALWLGEKWGFKYSTKAFSWAKLNPFHGKDDDDPRKTMPIDDPVHWQIGLGKASRRNTEDCWLFTKGQPKRVLIDRDGKKQLDQGVRELIVSPVREHSRKPDETYERIERLFEGPRCELFARNNRAGWSSWGNQVDKFE